ncbi:MAG: ATP synthase F1 subunit gamma [bacterium]
MPNIRDTRKRIRTVENIKRITSALEKIAAARLFRAKNVLSNARPYQAALERVTQDLLNSQPEAAHPLLAGNRSGCALVVAVTSDRGFCGGYNTAAIEAAVSVAEKLGRENVKFIVFGKKGADYLDRRGYLTLARYINLPASLPAALVDEVAERAADLHRRGETGQTHLVMTEFVSMAKHVPRVKRVLPVERVPDPGRNYMNYAYEPGPGRTLEAILPRLVAATIWAGVLESAVSEHAERMFMMQRATKNTDDLIAWLTLVMNKARQAMITRELTDIVGAAETIA